MTLRNTFIAAAVALASTCSFAQAATFSGNFDVRVVNYTFPSQQSSSVALANQANFDARYNAGTDGVDRDAFTYSGDLDFFIDNLAPKNGDAETIADFFLGNDDGLPIGSLSGLDATVGALQLSKPTFQTTTLFEFTGTFSNGFEMSITHDDGFTIYDDGVELISYANPTGIRTTPSTGTVTFTGGEFKIVYAAANGNPSQLMIEGTPLTNNNEEEPPTPVALPASSLLLLGGLGVLGAAGMRRKTRG